MAHTNYWLLSNASTTWHNRPVYAEQTNVGSDLYWQLCRLLWRADPVSHIKPPAFMVDGTARLPDFLRATGVVDLFSHRFISLLSSLGVQFESLPVQLFDRASKAPLASSHELFHLMTVLPIVDRGNSTMSADGSVTERLNLVTLGDEPEYAMVRDAFLQSHVFVRDDVRQAIVDAWITGCRWERAADYRNRLRRKHW